MQVIQTQGRFNNFFINLFKLKIVKYPDRRLIKVSKPVKRFNKGLKRLAARMRLTQQRLWGQPVGLAAPQVGKRIRLILVYNKFYVNPEIIWMPEEGKVWGEEGCYSLEEEKYFQIPRAYAVTIRYQDLDGNFHEERFNGHQARVIQHEIDHLNGKLCIDHINPGVQKVEFGPVTAQI